MTPNFSPRDTLSYEHATDQFILCWLLNIKNNKARVSRKIEFPIRIQTHRLPTYLWEVTITMSALKLTTKSNRFYFNLRVMYLDADSPPPPHLFIRRFWSEIHAQPFDPNRTSYSSLQRSLFKIAMGSTLGHITLRIIDNPFLLLPITID